MRIDALSTLLVGIPVSLFAYVLFDTYRYRRHALIILSRNAFDEPGTQAIHSALESINATCREYTFGIERSANILFRGHRVTLVLGQVGCLSFAPRASLTWGTSTRLFALADSTQLDWMTAQSDVFKPAYLGSLHSVFWVNVKTLRRQGPAIVGAATP